MEKKKKSKKVTLYVYIPAELKKKLKIEALNRNSNCSVYIEEMLAKQLR